MAAARVTGPSARAVAARFLGGSDRMLANFIAQFRRHRDALYHVEYASQLTGEMMAEVAWEIGYEGDSYETTLRQYEAAARRLGVDLRAEYDLGAASR